MQPNIATTHTHRLMSPEAAEIKAAALNADPDEDWTYRAVHCPKGTGYSYIAVYDEDGEFIERM